MIPTYGLTHISLKVKDPLRSAAFYHQVFGTMEMYREENFIQIHTPNSKDILVFEKADIIHPIHSGLKHFGFRLVDPQDIHYLTEEIINAGGTIKEQGEFVPGEPYVFFYDPDGYEVEVWYEKIPEGMEGVS